MTAAATAPTLERLALGSNCHRCGAHTDEPCRTAAGRETRPHKTRTDRAVAQYVTAKRAAELDALPTDSMTGLDAITETEHGRVYPSFHGDGFVAAPHDSCPECPSVGATLCNYAGESLVFATRDEAVEALAHHAEHGCADVSDADAPTLVPGSPEWQAANGVELIDPRTPLAPEHLADAVREATLIAVESAARTMSDDQRAELVALVAAEYLATAARNRADDLAAFVTEARDEPLTIADEYVMTAADLKVIASDALDYPDPDGLVAALREAGYRFGETVTLDTMNAAAALNGYRDTLTHGTRVRHTNGDLGTVVGAVETDADGDVWVTVAFDGDETERRHPSTVSRA